MVIGQIVLICVLALCLAKARGNSRKPKTETSVGGLVGHMAGGTIRGCTASGKIRVRGAPESQPCQIGGLVGSMAGGTVESSTADIDIEYYAETLNDVLHNVWIKLWVIGGGLLVILWCNIWLVYHLVGSVGGLKAALIMALALPVYVLITANLLKFTAAIEDTTYVQILKLAVAKPLQVLRLFAGKVMGRTQVTL